MSLRVRHKEREIEIHLEGVFDFSVHAPFRDAYRHTDGPGSRYLVDLSSVQYIDSSALGMLLLLRDHAGGDGQNVTIRSRSPGVRRIFELARFDKLFVLE